MTASRWLLFRPGLRHSRSTICGNVEEAGALTCHTLQAKHSIVYLWRARVRKPPSAIHLFEDLAFAAEARGRGGEQRVHQARGPPCLVAATLAHDPLLGKLLRCGRQWGANTHLLS